jgi:hypothetical protein
VSVRVVADREASTVAVVAERDLDAVGGDVLADIGEGFLGDAIDGECGLAVQLSGCAADLDRRLDARVLFEVSREPLQSFGTR